jgi:uncharacterized damage-inducible protein DinB
MTTNTNEKTAIGLSLLIRQYTGYNAWVTQTLVNWLKTKPSDLLEKEIASSFPGIKNTLLHIWDTQRFWVAVLKRKPFPQSFRMGYDGTLNDIFEGFIADSEEFSAYVNSLSDEELVEVIELKTPWFESAQSRFQYIQHAVNHATYHRGQAITIGRHLGFTDAPMTDYNYFLIYSSGK